MEEVGSKQRAEDGLPDEEKTTLQPLGALSWSDPGLKFIASSYHCAPMLRKEGENALNKKVAGGL